MQNDDTRLPHFRDSRGRTRPLRGFASTTARPATVPRPPRVVLPDQPLHLMQRGNNRTPVFLDTEDFLVYRELLRRASNHADCALHAYVLMTNHVHLLATPRQANAPGHLMKAVSQGYARWFNRRYRRSGTLWEGRFRSAAIDSERYLFACSRYIELNPVRALMTERPEDYEWSSFRGNACGLDDPLLTPHPRYGALGTTRLERQNAYSALFAEPLDDAVIAALRRGSHTRTVLVPSSFAAALEEQQQRRLPPIPQGGDRRSPDFRARRMSPPGEA